MVASKASAQAIHNSQNKGRSTRSFQRTSLPSLTNSETVSSSKSPGRAETNCSGEGRPLAPTPHVGEAIQRSPGAQHEPIFA